MHNGTVSHLTPGSGNYSVSVTPTEKFSEQSLIKLVCATGLHEKLSGKVNLDLNWSAITSTLCNTQIELYISVLSCKKTGM